MAPEKNPADCASRSLTPINLAKHRLWWNGPNFLLQPERTWPKGITMTPDAKQQEEMEEKPISLVVVVHEEEYPSFRLSSNLKIYQKF